MTRILSFDLETCPRDPAELIAQFEPEFKPEEVDKPRVSRALKDPVKIQQAEADLVERIADWERNRVASVEKQREEWIAKSALLAERGQILAGGWTIDGKTVRIAHQEENASLPPVAKERYVITEILNAIGNAQDNRYTVAGFNIMGFDLPFIRRRCMLLGMAFPFYNRSDKWKPWTFATYDAMEDWKCGNYKDTYASLDSLARGFGVGKKTGNGADFAKQYRENREASISYLTNDVLLTDKVIRKML